MKRFCRNNQPGQTIVHKTTVIYRRTGGLELQADVYRSNGDRVRPVIVYLHGGALILGSRELSSKYQFIEHLISLAEQNDYAIASFDYRLAPETKLPDIISDIEAAFSWLRGEGSRRFHLDADHLVVMGDSAGGYLTLVTGYRVNPRPKALVALYGYGELNTDWYSKANPYPNYNRQKITKEEAMAQTEGFAIANASGKDGRLNIYMYYRQNGLWLREVSGFDPSSLATEIASYEPAKNVTREFPPALFIHGTQDTDVPYEESVKMAAQLQRHGVPYILIPIDKGEHDFIGGNDAQTEEAFKTMKEFMIRYLETI